MSDLLISSGESADVTDIDFQKGRLLYKRSVVITRKRLESMEAIHNEGSAS